MDIENTSLLKSILIVGLGFLAYILCSLIYQGAKPSSDVFFLFFLLPGAAYFYVSLIGWYLIGMPVHRKLKAINQNKNIFHIVAALICGVSVSILIGIRPALIFLLLVIPQIILFRYFYGRALET